MNKWQNILREISLWRTSQKLVFTHRESERKTNKLKGLANKLWILDRNIFSIQATIQSADKPQSIFYLSSTNEFSSELSFTYDYQKGTLKIDDALRKNAVEGEEHWLVVNMGDDEYIAPLSKWQQKSPSRLPMEEQYRIALQLEEDDQTVLDISGQGNIFSIIIPIYKPDLLHLQDCLDSAVAQRVSRGFEVIATIDEIEAEGMALLESYLGKLNLRIQRNPRRKHISGNLNEGVALANGTYCLFLDQDDVLHPNALKEVYKIIKTKQEEGEEIDLIYSDEDKMSAEGRRLRPVYKPGFDPFYLCSTNYINHLVVVRKSLGDQVAWFREGYEGAQDHDFLLRASAQAKHIIHIPQVLYHWRMGRHSSASNYANKAYGSESSLKALKGYFLTKKINAKVNAGRFPGQFNYEPTFIDEPKVLLVLLSSGEVGADMSLLRHLQTTLKYDNWESCLIGLSKDGKRFKRQLKSFNNVVFHEVDDLVRPDFERLNSVLANAKADFIGFLGDTTMEVSENWIASSVGLFAFEDVAAIGTKVVDMMNRVQHAGQVLKLGSNAAGNIMQGMLDADPGYIRKDVIRQISASQLNGFFVRADALNDLDGIDSNLNINDISMDLCLRLTTSGSKILYNPLALIKQEGLQDIYGLKENSSLFMEKHRDSLERKDPAYNPNLSRLSVRPTLDTIRGDI